MFTETERTILNALPPKYKYIFRSHGGELIICESAHSNYHYFSIREFNHLFKDVKADAEPIRFREPILDDIEREYLKAVFKPFASRIKCVKKERCFEMWKGMEYIRVIMKYPDADNTCFPLFKAGTMYKGMNPDKEYTLDELGITYD